MTTKVLHTPEEFVRAFTQASKNGWRLVTTFWPSEITTKCPLGCLIHTTCLPAEDSPQIKWAAVFTPMIVDESKIYIPNYLWDIYP